MVEDLDIIFIRLSSQKTTGKPVDECANNRSAYTAGYRPEGKAGITGS